jgi:hypothetical protein
MMAERSNEDVHARLATQALRRPLSDTERALAEAMEMIFASGEHDVTAVVRLLNDRHVARPSGQAGAWSVEVLESELLTINRSLDEAYAAAPAIASYR